MDDPGLSAALLKALRLKDLQFLQRVADLRSLSGAAAEFGLTQPAASRWLGELERLFGGHLFTRDRRAGMTPTALGQLVVGKGRALVADVESLSAEIGAQREGRGGRLQLGVIPYVSSRLLERLVASLVTEAGMTVSIVEAATEPLLEALQLQRLHAVVGRSSLQPLAPGLKQETLFTQKACLIVHARQVPRGTATLADFAERRWVAPPLDSPTWLAIASAYAAAKVPLPVPVVETASTKVAHALVAGNTDMVAVLPADIGADLEKLGGVRVVPFPASFRMPPVSLLAHARNWNASHIMALRRTLRDLVASAPARS